MQPLASSESLSNDPDNLKSTGNDKPGAPALQSEGGLSQILSAGIQAFERGQVGLAVQHYEQALMLFNQLNISDGQQFKSCLKFLVDGYTFLDRPKNALKTIVALRKVDDSESLRRNHLALLMQTAGFLEAEEKYADVEVLYKEALELGSSFLPITDPLMEKLSKAAIKTSKKLHSGTAKEHFEPGLNNRYPVGGLSGALGKSKSSSSQTRLNAYFAKSESLHDARPELENSKRAIQEKPVRDEIKELEICIAAGELAFSQKNYAEAVQYLEDSRHLFKRPGSDDPVRIKKSMRMLADVYIILNEPNKAFTILREFESLLEPSERIKLFSTIALMNEASALYEQAAVSCWKALEAAGTILPAEDPILKELNQKYIELHKKGTQNKAITQTQLEVADKLLDGSQEKAALDLPIDEKERQFFQEQLELYFQKGTRAFDSGDFATAAESFESANNLLFRLGQNNSDRMKNSLHRLIYIYLQLENPDNTLSAFENLSAIDQSFLGTEKVRILAKSAAAYTSNKRFSEAAATYWKALQLATEVLKGDDPLLSELNQLYIAARKEISTKETNKETNRNLVDDSNGDGNYRESLSQKANTDQVEPRLNSGQAAASLASILGKNRASNQIRLNTHSTKWSASDEKKEERKERSELEKPKTIDETAQFTEPHNLDISWRAGKLALTNQDFREAIKNFEHSRVLLNSLSLNDSNQMKQCLRSLFESYLALSDPDKALSIVEDLSKVDSSFAAGADKVAALSSVAASYADNNLHDKSSATYFKALEIAGRIFAVDDPLLIDLNQSYIELRRKLVPKKPINETVEAQVLLERRDKVSKISVGSSVGLDSPIDAETALEYSQELGRCLNEGERAYKNGDLNLSAREFEDATVLLNRLGENDSEQMKLILRHLLDIYIQLEEPAKALLALESLGKIDATMKAREKVQILAQAAGFFTNSRRYDEANSTYWMALELANDVLSQDDPLLSELNQSYINLRKNLAADGPSRSLLNELQSEIASTELHSELGKHDQFQSGVFDTQGGLSDALRKSKGASSNKIRFNAYPPKFDSKSRLTEEAIKLDGPLDDKLKLEYQQDLDLKLHSGKESFGRGNFAQSLKHFEDAVALLNCLQLQDSHQMKFCFRNLLECYQEVGDPDRALETLDRLIKIDDSLTGSEKVKILTNSASLFANNSRYDEAWATYWRALELASDVLPDDDPLMSELNEAYISLHKKFSAQDNRRAPLKDGEATSVLTSSRKQLTDLLEKPAPSPPKSRSLARKSYNMLDRFIGAARGVSKNKKSRALLQSNWFMFALTAVFLICVVELFAVVRVERKLTATPTNTMPVDFSDMHFLTCDRKKSINFKSRTQCEVDNADGSIDSHYKLLPKDHTDPFSLLFSLSGNEIWYQFEQGALIDSDKLTLYNAASPELELVKKMWWYSNFAQKYYKTKHVYPSDAEQCKLSDPSFTYINPFTGKADYAAIISQKHAGDGISLASRRENARHWRPGAICCLCINDNRFIVQGFDRNGRPLTSSDLSQFFVIESQNGSTVTASSFPTSPNSLGNGGDKDKQILISDVPGLEGTVKLLKRLLLVSLWTIVGCLAFWGYADFKTRQKRR
jgi:hypothetical protein